MAERRASGALEEMQNLPSVIVSDFSLLKEKKTNTTFPDQQMQNMTEEVFTISGFLKTPNLTAGAEQPMHKLLNITTV